MISSHQSRSRAPQYNLYDDVSYQQALGSRRDSTLFLENDFGASLTRNGSPHHRRSGRSYNFDETIAKVDEAIKGIHTHLVPLLEQFRKETEYIKIYANPSVLDSLWEMRLDLKPKMRRNSDRDSVNYDTSQAAEMIQMTKRAKQAWLKAEKALQVAASGTKPTVSVRRRRLAVTENKEAIERAVPKLQTFGNQCLDLLIKAKKKYSQVRPLMKELHFLDQIIRDWEEFADGRGESDDYRESLEERDECWNGS